MVFESTYVCTATTTSSSFQVAPVVQLHTHIDRLKRRLARSVWPQWPPTSSRTAVERKSNLSCNRPRKQALSTRYSVSLGSNFSRFYLLLVVVSINRPQK